MFDNIFSTATVELMNEAYRAQLEHAKSIRILFEAFWREAQPLRGNGAAPTKAPHSRRSTLNPMRSPIGTSNGNKRNGFATRG